MLSFFDYQQTTHILENFCRPFESACLVNSEGQVLYTKYETISDLGTLQVCINTVRQYFPLQAGDVVLTNDPYVGGSLLSAVTMISTFKLAEQSFYLAIRTRFRPKMVLAKKLEDEGIRIPPTPIATQGKLNQEILLAMSGHPLCPEDFKSRVEYCFSQIQKQTQLFQSFWQMNKDGFSKSHQKNYLTESRQRLKTIFDDLSRGDSRFEVNFETGEVIRLRLELNTEGFHFDFAGTSSSSRLFLTNPTTVGSCIGSVITLLEEDIPVNEALFSFIKVTTPLGCFLNAKYPSPLFEGTMEGSSVLNALTTHALLNVGKNQGFSLNGTVPSLISFEFSKDLVFADAIAGGLSASGFREGLDGHYLWSLNRLQPSVEEIEKRFPLRVLHCGIRPGSGGKGKLRGGHGILKEYQLNAPCLMRWMVGRKNPQIKELKGAGSGMPSEITIQRSQGGKESVPTMIGEVALNPGDRVCIASAGGAGYGKPE